MNVDSKNKYLIIKNKIYSINNNKFTDMWTEYVIIIIDEIFTIAHILINY